MMTGISDVQQRQEALTLFQEMYTPAIGTGAVLDYLCHTGTDVLKGADILKQAPARYTSTVQYPDARPLPPKPSRPELRWPRKWAPR
jgi:hypothetical protein